MKNIIILDGMDFSAVGLGQIVNTPLDATNNPTPGYINVSGGLATTNAGWNARMRFSSPITIPAGTTAIVGTSDSATDHRSSGDELRLPIIAYYNSDGECIGVCDALSYIEAEYVSTTSGIIYRKGSVMSNVPANAANLRVQWLCGGVSPYPGDDPNEDTIMPNGPVLVFSKLV